MLKIKEINSTEADTNIEERIKIAGTEIEERIKAASKEIEDRIKIASTEASKTAAGEAVSLAMKELDARLWGTGSGGKIQQILKRASMKEQGSIDNEIPCPTCKHTGHNHSLKDIGGGKLKCNGDDCGFEYSLISSNADYYCTACQAPHSRPKNRDDEANDSCPFCGNEDFMKADYKKIRERVAKRQKR